MQVKLADLHGEQLAPRRRRVADAIEVLRHVAPTSALLAQSSGAARVLGEEAADIDDAAVHDDVAVRAAAVRADGCEREGGPSSS